MKLYICYKLVRKHHSNQNLRSSCGSGQSNMIENNTFARGNDRNIIWKIETNIFCH